MSLVPLEEAVVIRIKRYVKKRGMWLFKTNGDGLPDLVGCYKGVFFGIEVKRPLNDRGRSSGYGVTPLQKHRLQQIRDAGGCGIVARHQDEVLTWMDEVDQYGCVRVEDLPEIA